MNSEGYEEGRNYALRNHKVRGLSYIETLRALPLSLSGGDRRYIHGVVSGILSLDEERRNTK